MAIPRATLICSAALKMAPTVPAISGGVLVAGHVHKLIPTGALEIRRIMDLLHEDRDISIGIEDHIPNSSNNERWERVRPISTRAMPLIF